MPMPPSPYTSIEVLLAIFESYMHNCTTTSIEALLPMSKYYIYKQAIHFSFFKMWSCQQADDLLFQQGDEVEMEASYGPQCFAAFAATMGEIVR